MLVGIRNGTAVYTYITGHAENDPVQKCAWRLQCLGGFICYVLGQSNGGNTKFPDSAVFGIQFITSLYVCNDAEHIRALAEGGRILTFFYIRYGMRALCTCRCAQISRRFIILPRRWLSSRIVWKLHVAGSISGPISHKLNFGHNGRRLQIVVGFPTETFNFSVSMYFSRTMVKTQSVHYLF